MTSEKTSASVTMSHSTSTKRASPSEDFTRSNPSKKPRFDVRNPSALAPDAAEDDAILDADVIGARGQQRKRNAVEIDGYDSDSDNENFDSRAQAKHNATKQSKSKSKDEEENDMFADLEDDFKDGDDSEGDADRSGGKGAKKAVRFLDADEIEGQVKNSTSGGHVSADFTLNGKKGKERVDKEVESSSDSEVDDEIRANAGQVDEEIGAGGKKDHAPKLDAFNMRNEQDDGRFDDQGNFVRKAMDPDAKHDLWLEGVSKKDMKKAKDAHEKREEDRRKQDLENDAKSIADVLKSLIPLLDRGETVLEALARLGKGKKEKPKWQTKKKNQRSNGTHDADMAEEDSAELKRRQDVEAITAAADLLLTRGQPEVYDAERELLIRQYNRESGEQWQKTDEQETDDREWEFRWADARDGGNINGPYDTNTMRQWQHAGYFGEGVEFRPRGQQDSSWTRIIPF